EAGVPPPRRARGIDLRGVRLALGFGLLVVVGMTAINVTVWHNARRRIETEAWRRLDVATDLRLADIDHVLDVFRREALSVARDPYIVSPVRSAPPGSGSDENNPLLDELFARSAEFEFRNVAVLDASCAALGEWHPRSLEQTELDREAARDALRTGQPAWCCPHYGKTAIA